MKKVYLLIVWVITFFPVLQAQNVFLEWVKKDTTPGVVKAEAFDVSLDVENNVLITGRAETNIGPDAIVTIKYAPSGSLLWRNVKEYTGLPGYTTFGRKVEADKHGNVLVAGQARTNDNTAIIKYYKDGTLAWSKLSGELGIYGYGGAKDMAVYNDGSVAVLSATDFHNGQGPAFLLIKVDSSGGYQWDQAYSPSSATDYPAAMAIDKNENVYIAGGSFHFFGSGTYDYFSAKYKPNGSREWISHYNSASNKNDQALDIAVNDSGYQFITGIIEVNGQLDMTTIKQNSFGTRLWAKTYAGDANENDSAVSVAVDKFGNAVVTGVSYELHNNLVTSAMFTIKYDKDGNEKWKKYEYGNTDKGAGGVQVATDETGAVYVAGYQYTNIGTDILVLKYSANGAREWEYVYNGYYKSDDYAHALEVKNGDVYITGYETGLSFIKNYVVIKLNQDNVPAFVETAATPPIHIYPNPASDYLSIEIGNDEISTWKATFFDMAGKIVFQKLIDSKATINIDHLPKGVYVLELNNQGNSIKKKIVKE